jgi:DNA-binding MarR family transcriptional regulator
MGWIADLLKEIPSAARYKAELEAMQTENAKLKEENARLNQAVEHYSKDIENLKKPLSLPSTVSDNEIKILEYIAHCKSYPTVTDITQELSITVPLADFHLQNLIDLNYVEDIKRPIFEDSKHTEDVYCITQNGRRHLMIKMLSKTSKLFTPGDAPIVAPLSSGVSATRMIDSV